MSQIEEIKNKIDIVEFIREYLPVKAAGASFQALCPFHNEKTPSFTISPDKQVWHCFGCGRGGDVFSFLMEKEGLNFPEALRLLANKAGIILKHENTQEYSERNRLLDIVELASKYYAHIFNQDLSSSWKNYLIGRGLNEETIKDWQIGLSRDSWDDLYKFLKSRPLSGRKFTDEEIAAAGLVIKKTGGGRTYYDRFRDRLMFPIWDVNGQVVAFTARVNPLKEDTEKLGKYINSPQSKVYDKSRILFGLNKAKKTIRSTDLAIVVEGQMDVIACHQHGFTNVVASSGTALSAEQVSLLKRFSNNLALLFDMDQAGQLAADRGIKEALAQDMNLKIIILDSGKDPADALLNNPDSFRSSLEAAKPMLEYYFNKISFGLDLKQLDNKRSVSAKMFAMIDLLNNKNEQGYWLKKLSEDLDFFETDTREEFVKWQSKHGSLKKSKSSASQVSSAASVVARDTIGGREEKLAERLLAVLMRFSELINYSVSNFEPDDFPISSLSGFYKNLIIYYNKNDSWDYNNFRDYLIKIQENGDSDALAYPTVLDKLALLGEKDFYDYDSVRAKGELAGIIAELKKYVRQNQIHNLQKEITKAEQVGNKEGLDRLMEELRKLTMGPA